MMCSYPACRSIRFPQTRGNPNGQWAHDLSQDARGGGGAAAAVRGGTKIIISNLNPNIVKDEDMKVIP